MHFFNNKLSKAKMTWTKLRNIFLQNESEKNRKRYRNNRNFCVSLLKKRYYENPNKTLFVDSKLIWKIVKPHLYNKVSGKDKIHLLWF